MSVMLMSEYLLKLINIDLISCKQLIYIFRLFSLSSLWLECDSHIPELVAAFLAKESSSFILASDFNYPPFLKGLLLLDALPDQVALAVFGGLDLVFFIVILFLLGVFRLIS